MVEFGWVDCRKCDNRFILDGLQRQICPKCGWEFIKWGAYKNRRNQIMNGEDHCSVWGCPDNGEFYDISNGGSDLGTVLCLCSRHITMLKNKVWEDSK